MLLSTNFVPLNSYERHLFARGAYAAASVWSGGFHAERRP
jgi:hypothetical protein